MSTQATMIPDYHPLQDEDDESYMSLFPGLDKFIWYTPSYVLENRNHIIHRIFIGIVFLALSSAQILTLMVFWKLSTSGIDRITFGFMILMVLLPWIASGLRLYFFIYRFTFKNCIWHRPRKSISNPSKYESSLSFILKQEPYLLARMCKRFKIGCWILSIIIIVMTLFHLMIYFQYVMPHLFNESINGINYSRIGGIIYIFVQSFSQQIPDALMICVGRLYYTESHLAIIDFTKKLKMMNIRDIVEKDVHQKYLEMHQFIDSNTKHFKYFILTMILVFCWLCWYLLAIFQATATKLYYSKAISMQNFALIGCYVLFNGIANIFILWPAFRMTELFDQLTDIVDDKIDTIMQNRIHLYNKEIINPLMKCLSDNNDTTLLRKNINKWDEQSSALEILNALLNKMEQKPVSYQCFGLSLDRYSILNFIIGLAIGKILSLMWDSV